MKKKVIKKVLSTLLVAIMLLTAAPLNGFVKLDLFSVSANAADIVETGKCGENVTYTLDSDGNLVISGTGEMYCYGNYYYDYLIYSAFDNNTYIKTVTIENGVTSIGDYSFYYCTGITSVIIDSNITSIGEYSFFNCTSLINVTIPDTVTNIGYSAFENCTNLKNITLPENITHIQESAFYNTGAYNDSDNWDNGVFYIDDCIVEVNETANGSIIIKSGIKSINERAFDYCNNLTAITIPDSVSSIGCSAFSGCTGITKTNYSGTIEQWCNIDFADFESNPICYSNNLYINDKLVTKLEIANSIRNNAFCNLKSLKEVVLLDGVISIGDFAFSGCTGLASITIADSVTAIGEAAFSGCSELKLVDIPYGITIINNSTFSNCNSLTTVSIPSSVTAIGEAAFSGCSGLKFIDIPEGVTIINSSTFSSCYSLTNITLPNSIIDIGDYAFSGCSSLTEINIPDSVTGIGSYAFYDCTRLTSITIPDGVISIGSYAFSYCTDLTEINYNAIEIQGLSEKSNVFYNAGTSGTGIDVVFDDTVKRIPNYLFYYYESYYSSYRDYTPNIVSVTIPDSVISIGENVFSNCYKLKKTNYKGTIEQWLNIDFKYNSSNPSYHSNNLYLNDNLIKQVVIPPLTTELKGYSFVNNSAITSVVIPKSVLTIDEYVFSGCYGITDIYYEGTEEDWENVFINDGNDYIVNAKIHYNTYDSVHVHSYISEEIQPTCTFGGYYKEYCSVCGEIKTYEEKEALGHSFGDWVVYSSATCTIEGTKARVCSVCNCSEYETIPATGHNIVIDEAVAPTCTASGKTEGSHCSVCNQVFQRQYTINSKGHKYSGWTVVTKPTLYNTGLRKRTCLTCKEEFEEIIPKQSYADVFYYYVRNNQVIIDGLKYRFQGGLTVPTEINGYTVVGIDSCTFSYQTEITSITFPDTVKSISYCAFTGCSSLKTIDFGNNPDLQLDYDMFDGCTGLEKMIVGSDCQNYCTDSFGVLYNNDKTGLIQYPIGSTLTSYTVDSNVAYINEYAFYDADNLESVVLPNDIMSIGEGAFMDCDGLMAINIPDGTDTICYGAFEDCRNVKTISIPESVTVIGRYAFAGCSAVEEITYNAKEANTDKDRDYIFIGCGENSDGVDMIFGDSVEYVSGKMFIYSMYYSTIKYPQANIKFITIGENFKCIGEGVFSNLVSLEELNFKATNYLGDDNKLFENCDNLITVNFGDNVKTIPNYFLYGCDGIESITITESVEKIGKYAFNDCSKLTDEIFKGTNQISINGEINKGSFNAHICCFENSFLHYFAITNGLKCKIIQSDEENFVVKNNVLIKYNGNSEFVYCNVANEIGYNAFYGNESLKTLELSGIVSRIYDKAFENCSNLEKIIIPQSITSIGDQAFKGCDNLTIWCYVGSFAEQFALTHNIPIHYITMEISDTVVELNSFDVCQLSASLNVDLAEEELIWTSDNPNVVTVSPDGKLTAVGVGKATITATSSSGLSVKCIVTVSDENQPDPEYVESASINDLALNYNRTAKLDLTVNCVGEPEYTIEYTSSNPKVAIVDADGIIKTTGKGNATITVIVTDSLGNVATDTCNVNVKFTFWQWLLYIICFGWIWM